ncbi:MAG: NUDIX hydrolase [Bacilli bacterium]
MQEQLIKDIEEFIPFNEQEEKDKTLILKALGNESDIFTRQNTICHMTASAWVVNKDCTKVIMAFHNIYNSWSWLGGHADGDTDLLKVAIKEVKEESSLTNVIPLSKKIFSLEVLTVDGHIKKGQYVSSHLHLNVTYLLQADDQEEISIKKDENSSVGWFELDKAITASSEEWFKKNIYTKLNQKLALFLSSSSKTDL